MGNLSNYHSFIETSSIYIKNQALFNFVKDFHLRSVGESIDGYIFLVWDYRINSLINQIKNSDKDTILIHIANKWRKISDKYKVDNFSPLRINLPIVFKGDYSKRVNNYIVSKKNERKYLQAYKSIRPDGIDSINKRIDDINCKIFDVTKSNFEVKRDNFESSSYMNEESERIDTIILKNKITKLENLDLN